MGKDKNGWKKHGPYGILPCSGEFCGEYDGGSQSRKIRKHLMGNTSPIRYGTMENAR